MSSLHSFVVRWSDPFVLHTIVSSIVLALAIAISYLPRLSARTRFVILAGGVAKFILPASLLAPFFDRTRTVALFPMSMPHALPIALRPAAAPAATALDWCVVVAAAIALLFIAGSIISSARAVATAIRTGGPASSREVTVLNAARKRVGIPYAIDLVRSPISEAPAVLRVLRPLIVIPAEGAETLDDDELESLLAHECAHVARRDNLVALLEALVRALFWFNPLIWLAHRRLAEEREKACDEIVADDARRAETYAQALVKFCQAILARPPAGVSCMASAHLKQRMEHIMSLKQSPSKAVRHFAVTALSVAVLFAAVAATAAISNPPQPASDPYTVMLKVGKIGNDFYAVRVAALDKSKNALAWTSRPLKVHVGETFKTDGASAIGNEPELSFHAEGSVAANGNTSAHVDVMRGSDLIQRASVKAIPQAEGRYSGEPISLNLKDADIRDVLAQFAKLTGLQITAGEGVEGKIDVNLVDVPWDQAFDQILREHGYTYKLNGKELTVFRQ